MRRSRNSGSAHSLAPALHVALTVHPSHTPLIGPILYLWHARTVSIAGHVSPKMLAHYSHVRMDAKRKALDALSAGSPGGSYDTKSDTKPPTGSNSDSQVERNGGREGIRTLGLLVANEALSQLSYSPTSSDLGNFSMTRREDSNRVPNY